MTIEGLCVQPENPTAPIEGLKAGQPDVDEAIGVTLEAYKTLGFAPDEDQATESLKENFKPIAELGYDGRLYVEPPQGVSFDAIIAAAERKRPSGVEEAYRWPNLWVPGTKKKSYTVAELDAAAEEPEARLAAFNADENTEVDRLLHFLNQPYDDEYREGASQTQLEALAALEKAFAEKHEQSFLRSLGHRAAGMFILMDRIRGVDSSSNEFVLNRGWMRVPEFGRRKVDVDSVVGFVLSFGGQAEFGRSFGFAGWGVGVGVSLGQKELDPQAS